MDEFVLCFERNILDAYENSPITFYDNRLWRDILAHLKPLARSSVEDDYTHKQLVVYVLVSHDNSFLTYQRTAKSDEARLRQKYSIGIGGHINLQDKSQLSLFGSDQQKWTDFVLDAVWREVNEEVQIKAPVTREPELICFINDDSNDVGKVHFGLVWLLKLTQPAVLSKGERGIGRLQFFDLTTISSMKASFENWSQLLVDFLLQETSLWAC